MTDVRVQIGSSHQVLPGFVNVDIRPIDGATRGHAADLRFAEDSSVELLFTNAVFEHLFLGQQLLALREWRRAVGPDGTVVCLGIPNFPEIARRYLAGAPGILGERFDLYHVYRYTHGDPDAQTYTDWRRVSPARSRNRSPDEWLPQLHKSIFDASTVSELFVSGGFPGTNVFEYAFPGEPYPLNLGAVTADIRVGLAAVPGIHRWIDVDTIRALEPDEVVPAMAQKALELADRRVSRRTEWRGRLRRSSARRASDGVRAVRRSRRR